MTKRSEDITSVVETLSFTDEEATNPEDLRSKVPRVVCEPTVKKNDGEAKDLLLRTLLYYDRLFSNLTGVCKPFSSLTVIRRF